TPVLREERLVEVQRVADPDDLGHLGVHAAGQRVRRFAGHDQHEAVHDERDEEEERDQRDETPQDEGTHETPGLLPTCWRCGTYFLMYPPSSVDRRPLKQ